MPTFNEIAAVIETAAPLHLQEEYDNSGWQVLHDGNAECSGVLTCVDAVPAVIDEAISLGFNLVLSHHPVMFRGQKSFTGASVVQRTVMKAIRHGIAIYSCHTAIDSAPGGVSSKIADLLGLTGTTVLVQSQAQPDAGLGIIGSLRESLNPAQLAEHVKGALGVPVTRCSRPADPLKPVTRVALCGGSGSEFIPAAISAGAGAYITSDTKYHDFVDHGPEIFIIDIGHHEAENCVSMIFNKVITENFTNFAVQTATVDVNPIIYL